jgi:integrase
LSGAAQRGEVAMQRGVLFETYADRWVGEQEALVRAGSMKVSTYVDYKGAVDNHLKPFFEGLRLDEMTRADVRAFTTAKLEQGNGDKKRKLAPKTINNLLGPLGLILRQAAEDGCTILSPETGLRRVKVPNHESEWYEVDEAHRLVKHTPKQWRALIGLAVYAGLRQGEILAIRWSDVDWAHNRVYVRQNLQPTHKAAAVEGVERLAAPKSERGNRAVPLRPVLRQLLEQHKPLARTNELGLLFASRSGSPLDARNVVREVYEPAVKRAGLRQITFHSLRHTFVTMCAAAGVPLAKVGDWVGHSDSKITEIYRHASADSEAFAVGLLDAFEGGSTRAANAPPISRLG